MKTKLIIGLCFVLFLSACVNKVQLNCYEEKAKIYCNSLNTTFIEAHKVYDLSTSWYEFYCMDKTLERHTRTNTQKFYFLSSEVEECNNKN